MDILTPTQTNRLRAYLDDHNIGIFDPEDLHDLMENLEELLDTLETAKPVKMTEEDNNVGYRWENSIPHNPRSESIYETASAANWHFGDDSFSFKDGDNGENLMYSLDCLFWNEDN